MSLEQLKTEIAIDEGVFLYPYIDHKSGSLRIGIQRCLDTCPLTPEELAKVGHDCRSLPITRGQAFFLLESDIRRTKEALNRTLPWWRGMDHVRRRVLVRMAFGSGMDELLGLEEALDWMRVGHYRAAGGCMLDSAWAIRAGRRAIVLAQMMINGDSFPQQN